MYLLPAAVASILPLTIFIGGKIHDKGERYAPPGDTLPLFFINYFFGEHVKEQGGFPAPFLCLIVFCG